MNENEFDRTARAWLDDAPTQMSDRAVLSALEEIHTTRQRRAVWPAWRPTNVSNFARVAIAAVLVAVGLLAVNVVPRQPDGSTVGGPPAPSSIVDPTPSPSPSASPAQVIDFPSLSTTFISLRNGFSIKHPDGVAPIPATNIWGFGDAGFDVVETGSAAVFKGSSTEMPLVESGFVVDEPSNMSIDAWVDQAVKDLADECAAPRGQQSETTIDGQPGRISECPNQIDATVVAGGRLYLFSLLSDRADARAVFDAFAASIDLTPETAIDYPALPTTFVSPTYGYAFNYLDRGGLEPATERWDPVNHPPVDGGRGSFIGRDNGFDEVDTGLGAVFKGASMKIADEASIDGWIDDYISAGGCYVPRNEQAGITIDGHSGRISDECPDKVVATVVVDGRLYLFAMLHSRADARALFDAFAATIDLRPEDAAAPQ